ncbi:MAG: GNAT family N-acetyltransferase [Pseudomonadota bacterium]
MRAAEGWGKIDIEVAEASLAAGVFSACLYEDGRLIGFGRVIGDGVLYFYVQDLIVRPPHRGRGLGRRLMEHLLSKIKAAAAPGASVCLMASKGREDFYRSFGFTVRPNARFGAGMILVL